MISTQSRPKLGQPPAFLLAALILVLSACQNSGGEATATANSPSQEVDSIEATDDHQSNGDADETESVLDETTLAAAAGGRTIPVEVDDTEAGSSTYSSKLAVADIETSGNTLLANAVASTIEASSFRFEAGLEIESVGDPAAGSASVAVSGSRSGTENATSLTVDLGGIGPMVTEGSAGEDLTFFKTFFVDPIEVIVIGETAWVNWDLFAMFVPADQAQDDFWIEMAAAEGGAIAGDLGAEAGFSDPAALLESLENVQGDVEVLGPDQVRGTATTRYRMHIELAELQVALPDGGTAEPGTVVPVEFWVGDDGLLRRVEAALTDPKMLTDDGIAAVTIDVELFDFGQDLGIEPPPADQIVTDDDVGFDLSDGL